MKKRFPVIDPGATGANIARLRRAKGLSVRDVQRWFGFEEPQAIYKWQQGKTLPSVDNLYALCTLLEVPMEELLVERTEEEEEQQDEPCCSFSYVKERCIRKLRSWRGAPKRFPRGGSCHKIAKSNFMTEEECGRQCFGFVSDQTSASVPSEIQPLKRSDMSC